MNRHIDAYTAEVVREATSRLVLLDLMDSTWPVRPNVWSEQAHSLRVALDRLLGEQCPPVAHYAPSPTPSKR